MDPFVPGEGHRFAVFGYLDTAADTQYVRVARVRSDATFSSDNDDPPLVTTTNLHTGETVVWADSLIRLENGSLGLVYFAGFDIQPSATYRLDVTDEGAEPTRAFTTVPGTNGIIAGTPHPNRFGDLEQTVLWGSIARARDAHVFYQVRTLPTGVDTTIAISYVGLGERAPEGWIFGVTLERDYRLVRRFTESARGDTAIALLDLSMSIEAPSEEWTVTEEASNIENGTGFFASVGRFRESWSLDTTILQSIGYRTP